MPSNALDLAAIDALANAAAVRHSFAEHGSRYDLRCVYCGCSSRDEAAKHPCHSVKQGADVAEEFHVVRNGPGVRMGWEVLRLRAENDALVARVRELERALIDLPRDGEQYVVCSDEFVQELAQEPSAPVRLTIVPGVGGRLEFRLTRAALTVDDAMVERACKQFDQNWTDRNYNDQPFYDEETKVMMRTEMRAALTAALERAE